MCLYTSLERLHIRDGFETSYLRHVYKAYERYSNLPPNVCYVLCQTLQINFQRAKHCIVVSTELFFFTRSVSFFVRRLRQTIHCVSYESRCNHANRFFKLLKTIEA